MRFLCLPLLLHYLEENRTKFLIVSMQLSGKSGQKLAWVESQQGTGYGFQVLKTMANTGFCLNHYQNPIYGTESRLLENWGNHSKMWFDTQLENKQAGLA